MQPVVGDEGAADLAAFLGADRDVLQVRLGRRQPAGGGRGERVAGVHALGVRIDVVRQRVGVGRAQLRHLPPVEDLLRQLVALLGEVFQHSAPVDHAPVLVLVPPGRPILPNRMSPSCLGLPGLIGAPASLWISSSSPPCFCANSPDSRDSTCRSIEMPRCSMRAEHRHQRPLQRLVDGGDVLGRQPGFQRAPQPQRHVGVLGGIFRRLLDGRRSRTSPAPCRSRRPPRTRSSCGRAASRRGRPCRGRRARRRARRTSAWCRRKGACRCRAARKSASRI